jgi:hypothetical protein
MSRRIVTFLVIIAISLQGPSLAYSAALTTKAMPTGCASYLLGQNGHDNSPCCPDTLNAGLCCSGGVVFGGAPSLLVTHISLPARLLPPDAGSVAFATERPAPPLRPPIV